MKKLTLKPQSFSKTRYFPGCAGNPFDRVLHSFDWVESIPTIIIFFILAILAFLGSLPTLVAEHTAFSWQTGFLFGIFLLDWLLISLLPLTHRSFGPVKVVVFMLALLRLPFAFLPLYWNVGFEVIGTLLVLFGFYYEPFQIDVHYEQFSSSKLIEGHSLRVLHLGDLHLERTTRREKKLLEKINELSPDLILFSGDVLNLSYLTDPLSHSDAIEFFGHLSAPLGVFGVTGSPAVDFPDFYGRLAEATPLQWLDDQIESLDTDSGRINIIGLTCTHNPDLDEESLKKIKLSQEGLNILLHHSPDLSPNASRYALDLQLSGHTHGGQVRLPLYGAIFTGSLYGKTFEAGRYLVNGMPLYITRGIGMEGAIAPRVRFLARPEIILWELTNTS